LNLVKSSKYEKSCRNFDIANFDFLEIILRLSDIYQGSLIIVFCQQAVNILFMSGCSSNAQVAYAFKLFTVEAQHFHGIVLLF